MFTKRYGRIRKIKMKKRLRHTKHPTGNKKEFPDQKIVKNYKKAIEKNTITGETTWERRKKIL